MAKVEVSVPGLEKASEVAAVPARTLRAALDSLDGKLAQLGSVWGDDELGKQWAEQYVPGSEQVRGGLRNAATGLQSLSDDFKAMGLTYQNAEVANLE